MLCLGSHLLEGHCSQIHYRKRQAAGVDYIKVNFHTDNFVIVDKIINVLSSLSDLDYTLRDELCGLCSHVYTFLSYGYAVQAREGIL